jgi:hypothetical protein
MKVRASVGVAEETVKAFGEAAAMTELTFGEELGRR